MQQHAFRCFGVDAASGNPALVIESDVSTTDERQTFARAHNVTCVWIDPSDESGVVAVMDYFYPHARSPLCLHATLAAAQRLFALHGTDHELAVKTALHGQRLGLVAGDAGEGYVRLQVQDAPQPDITPGLIARLLATPELVPLAAPRVASVGSSKLLVEVADIQALNSLLPDLPGIVAWGKETGVNGLYVYCRLPNGDYQGRNFNHLNPALEDSATGVAAGALTVLLGHGINLWQGKMTGHACLIRARPDGAAILVGGLAQPISNTYHTWPPSAPSKCLVPSIKNFSSDKVSRVSGR